MDGAEKKCDSVGETPLGRRCVLGDDIKLDNGDQTAMFPFEWILEKNHAFDTCDANFGTWDELCQQMFVCGGLLRFYRLFEMSLSPSALVEESTTRALKCVISFNADSMRNYVLYAKQIAAFICNVKLMEKNRETQYAAKL